MGSALLLYSTVMQYCAVPHYSTVQSCSTAGYRHVVLSLAAVTGQEVECGGCLIKVGAFTRNVDISSEMFPFRL